MRRELQENIFRLRRSHTIIQHDRHMGVFENGTDAITAIMVSG